MKKIFIFLLLSLLSTSVFADAILIVEQKGKEIHFIYPELKKDHYFYYATWATDKNNCNATTKSLTLKQAKENHIYTIDNKKGILCLKRSLNLLGSDWSQHQIIPSENFLLMSKKATRTPKDEGLEDLEPETLEPETETELLSCLADQDNTSTCRIN